MHPGEATEDAAHPWIPATLGEFQTEYQVPAFGLAPFLLLRSFVESSKRWKIFHLTPCHSSLQINESVKCFKNICGHQVLL